jgi:hypothetical protein
VCLVGGKHPDPLKSKKGGGPHPKLLANLALVRNALPQVLAHDQQTQSLPQLRERLQSHPARCLALLAPS